MNRALALAAVLFAVLAGACTQSAPSGSAKMAARVNGTVISLAEGARPTAAALEKAIDRELLVQQALQAGLDRDPRVARELEEARRRVLAQAWLEHAEGRASPGPEEVARFYADNPALFGERRLYHYQELVVSTGAEGLDLVKDELTGARSLEDVAAWLKWRGLKVSPLATSTAPAEQLPLSYLPRLSRMKEGDMDVFASPLGASVIRLVAAQPAPLSEAQAAPVIERFLAGRKRLEVAAAEVQRLRRTASIEYVGDFKR